MNRKSLFGRLTASTIVSRPAERQSYFRLQLEPLEERKLLTVATTYINDNWYDSTTSDGIVRPGDLMVNKFDTVAPNTVFATLRHERLRTRDQVGREPGHDRVFEFKLPNDLLDHPGHQPGERHAQSLGRHVQRVGHRH